MKRFPKDFMFQLKKAENENLMFQIGISSHKHGGTRKLPNAFTEQGVAALSGVLRSKKAIQVNIQIMRAFVSMCRFFATNSENLLRLNLVEKRQIAFEIKTDKNFSKILQALEDKTIKPKQGIFFDGQIFDAYKFVFDLVKSAKKSIVLIDNYIDESVLTLFKKTGKNVNIQILTKNITKQLKLDAQKFSSQYAKINLEKFDKSHDRFLIIDNKQVYHFGASLKDVGKKWFSFNKIDYELLKDKLK